MKQVIADFRVERKTELYETLNAAVAAAYDHELDDRSHGVLVTRHDFKARRDIAGGNTTSGADLRREFGLPPR